jgi:hypothetical protein
VEVVVVGVVVVRREDDVPVPLVVPSVGGVVEELCALSDRVRRVVLPVVHQGEERAVVELHAVDVDGVAVCVTGQLVCVGDDPAVVGAVVAQGGHAVLREVVDGVDEAVRHVARGQRPAGDAAVVVGELDVVHGTDDVHRVFDVAGERRVRFGAAVRHDGGLEGHPSGGELGVAGGQLGLPVGQAGVGLGLRFVGA